MVNGRGNILGHGEKLQHIVIEGPIENCRNTREFTVIISHG